MLPLELVIVVANQLETGRSFFNLARTCKTYYRLLIDRPWNDISIHFDLHWGASASNSAPECRWIRQGAVQIISPCWVTRVRHTQCPMSPCEACEIESVLLPVNACLHSQAKLNSTGLRKLTLSGWLPQTLESMNEDAPGYSFEGSRGVCGLGPEILHIELGWASWSPIMLSSFDLTRLRSLSMPVRAPPDCIKIGAAFMDMPHLENLTITELSDSQDFVDEFYHLGDGVMALSPSLRSLDITINNSTRPEGRGVSEAFVEPDDVGFFFGKFFPEPSCNRIQALVRARFGDPREPLDVDLRRSSKGPLNLERVRLKHIGLPWWAFQTVISPDTIKELDLSTCRMTSDIWELLEKQAQLHKLANIDYKLLSGPFMSFISKQHSLRFLSFARPPDIYNTVTTRSRFFDFGRVITVTEAAPHLGPGTEWGRAHARNAWLLRSVESWTHHEDLIRSPRSWSYYENHVRSLSSYSELLYPKRSEFLKALSNKKSLTHLVLPADMLDITPKFMACLAIELPALESIEWAFDYACPILRSCFINDFLPGHLNLKKITLLSLNRPYPLSDFDAQSMHSAFASGPYDPAPTSLRYVRYRYLNRKSHEGKFMMSDVYYHRDSMVDGSWWLKLPESKGDGMFEDDI